MPYQYSQPKASFYNEWDISILTYITNCQAQVQVQVRWRSVEGQKGLKELRDLDLSYTLFLVIQYRCLLHAYT